MARHGNQKDFDWLEDPFNPEKKNIDPAQGKGGSGLGAGCVVAGVVAIVLVIAAIVLQIMLFNEAVSGLL